MADQGTIMVIHKPTVADKVPRRAAPPAVCPISPRRVGVQDTDIIIHSERGHELFKIYWEDGSWQLYRSQRVKILVNGEPMPSRMKKLAGGETAITADGHDYIAIVLYVSM